MLPAPEAACVSIPDGMRAAIIELFAVVDDWGGRCDGVRPVEQGGEEDSFAGAFAGLATVWRWG